MNQFHPNLIIIDPDDVVTVEARLTNDKDADPAVGVSLFPGIDVVVISTCLLRIQQSISFMHDHVWTEHSKLTTVRIHTVSKYG